MSGRRVAILHDSPDYGGHERAFLSWLPTLIASDEIEALNFLIPASNEKFHQALAAFDQSKIKITRSPYTKGPAEPFLAPLRGRYGLAAARFVATNACDVVLLVQGRIENLATPMIWLPRQIDLVSYLPMAHSGVELGKPALVSAITDRVKRFYYRRPSRVVVPSKAVAEQVRLAGRRGDIVVVENVVDIKSSGTNRVEARLELGLQANKRIALYLGRFDVFQKGLDRLLRDLRTSSSKLKHWQFLFIGHGPGLSAISQMLEEGEIDGQIIDWTDRPETYLAASDVLILPSRFEGVPLIMLEALQQKIPILASDIDVFREYLPDSFLHDFSHPVDIESTLEYISSSAAKELYHNHIVNAGRIQNVAESGDHFARAVLGTSAD